MAQNLLLRFKVMKSLINVRDWSLQSSEIPPIIGATETRSRTSSRSKVSFQFVRRSRYVKYKIVVYVILQNSKVF